MVFENLSNKLQEVFKKLKGKGRLTEEDVNLALREVRIALLEADVNFQVVKDFIAKVKEKAVGHEVLESLTPGQQVIKIVHEELINLMGKTNAKLNDAGSPPTIIMLVGLQGAGKTTTAAKLAYLLKKQGKKPLLVAADVYRPAAIKQLQVLGDTIDVPVFTMGEQSPVDIAKASINFAKSNLKNYVIIDTAGRLHINEELMDELKKIKDVVHPHEILLVVDAMTGQDAVNVAKSFNDELGLTGVILTKLDGDTKGGAALSVKAVTGCPIKFAGMGEKIENLEPFYPDRMASRILGMGDVLTLIEKAKEALDAEKAQKMQEKLKSREFDLEDFLDSMQQIKKMGPLEQLLGMIPGMGKVKDIAGMVDEKELKHIEAIIYSMTPEERRKPEIIDGSRKKRIAKGSGTSIQEVNRLLKQFEQMKKLMKQFGGMEKQLKKGKKIKFPFFS
ncbi:signal recognition particle protein [Carboxydothermus hydrogenoformans]|uniref:Signal recognition particle protein n=1 Tax=Carboxydothermus hydrogenoformans (strain ATCC BAA-161 / DSM 6008 / Z-2901) TaxID=246194 RepID=Q3AC68_CARHZ|nr:signal recognition particle protein [Carboxydothermus hydrogenoformans]ABB13690.1 signal recognition particle protein [Carboxydothermus hydrogenoformans Z-2901]